MGSELGSSSLEVKPQLASPSRPPRARGASPGTWHPPRSPSCTRLRRSAKIFACEARDRVAPAHLEAKPHLSPSAPLPPPPASCCADRLCCPSRCSSSLPLSLYALVVTAAAQVVVLPAAHCARADADDSGCGQEGERRVRKQENAHRKHFKVTATGKPEGTVSCGAGAPQAQKRPQRLGHRIGRCDQAGRTDCRGTSSCPARRALQNC